MLAQPVVVEQVSGQGVPMKIFGSWKGDFFGLDPEARQVSKVGQR